MASQPQALVILPSPQPALPSEILFLGLRLNFPDRPHTTHPAGVFSGAVPGTGTLPHKHTSVSEVWSLTGMLLKRAISLPDEF